jgi:hypothetical protein
MIRLGTEWMTLAGTRLRHWPGGRPSAGEGVRRESVQPARAWCPMSVRSTPLIHYVAILVGSVGLLLIAAGLRGWPSTAAYTPVAPRLAPSPQVQELGRVSLHESRRASFRIANVDHSRAVRLIGANDSCDKDGCVAFRSRLPLTIPPGAAVEVVVEYKAMALGRCKKEMPVYTHAPGQPEIPLVVVCDVFKPEDPQSGSKLP